jgi:hypothetical protein
MYTNKSKRTENHGSYTEKINNSYAYRSMIMRVTSDFLNSRPSYEVSRLPGHALTYKKTPQHSCKKFRSPKYYSVIFH